QGPVVRLVGRLAQLDVGFIRLHDLPADHAADLAGIRRPADRSDGGVYGYPVDASRRWCRLGLAWGSGRAPPPADDLDPRLFAVQLHRRFLAGLLVSVPVSRSARLFHGGGVAGRRGVGHGAMADPLARADERDIAGVVGHRLPAVERRLWAAVHLDRLARPVVDRRFPGAAGG